MWFVAPEPGLTQQSSWGLWGEELRAGEAGWRGSGSVVVVGPGAPDQGDSAWAALELSGDRKWRLILPTSLCAEQEGIKNS